MLKVKSDLVPENLHLHHLKIIVCGDGIHKIRYHLQSMYFVFLKLIQMTDLFIQLFQQIIEKILQDSKPDKQLYLKERISFDFSGRLNNGQALSLFANYAETPDSLNNYLQQVTSNSALS